MQKKYNFVYKTTNNLNGDYYYGVHQTNDLNDGYLGSGKILWRAINKYGKENFTREIVQYFSNINNAYRLEAAIVTSELVSDPHCYNIALGGFGGNLIEGFSEEQRNIIKTKISSSRKGIAAWNKGLNKQNNVHVAKYSKTLKEHEISEETRKKISESNKGKTAWNTGKKNCFSEDAIQKMRRAKENYIPWSKGKKQTPEHIRNHAESLRQSGKMKNKKWINNGSETKFINVSDIELFLNNGWQLGRIKINK